MSGFTGFENPTTPYREKPLNLGDIILRPASTFIYQKAQSDTSALVRKDDWVVVDASMKPESTDLVLAEQYGEQSIVPLAKIHNIQSELTVIGTATAIIRHHRPAPPLPKGKLQKELHPALIPMPAAAFLSKAKGSRMAGLGIRDNSLLIVRRDVDYQQGDLAVVYADNAFQCRLLNLSNGTLDDGLGVQTPITGPLAIEGVVTASISFQRQVIPQWQA